MEVFSGKTEGSIELTESLHLQGMVAGNLSVGSKFALIVDGMVTGDLIVADDAVVTINGMVHGDVIANGGNIKIYGCVKSVIKNSETAQIWISENAILTN